MSRDTGEDLWGLAFSNSNVLGDHVRRQNDKDVGRAIAALTGFGPPTPTPSPFAPSPLPPPPSSLTVAQQSSRTLPVQPQSPLTPPPPTPTPPPPPQRQPPPPPPPHKTTSPPQQIVHGSRSGNARRARDGVSSAPIGPGQTAANGAQPAPQPQATPPSYPAYPSSHGVPGRRPRNPPGTLQPWRIGGQP